jgi:hypothetical protein
MQRRRIPLAVLTLLLLLAGLAADVKAQAVYGSVIGTVTDPQGAAVAGAQVSVTDLTKNITTTVQTNDEGNYTVTTLFLEGTGSRLKPRATSHQPGGRR